MKQTNSPTIQAIELELSAYKALTRLFKSVNLKDIDHAVDLIQAHADIVSCIMKLTEMAKQATGMIDTCTEYGYVKDESQVTSSIIL